MGGIHSCYDQHQQNFSCYVYGCKAKYNDALFVLVLCITSIQILSNWE